MDRWTEGEGKHGKWGDICEQLRGIMYTCIADTDTANTEKRQ